MNEKLSAYQHFMENLINPSNPSLFMMSVLRNVETTERENIKNFYKKLSVLQIKTMGLDTIYSEKEEAGYITSTFNEWQDLKKKIFKLISLFDAKYLEGSSSIERGYFS